MCRRGTLSIAVDSNFRFHRDFYAEYKNIRFKYVLGKNQQTDTIVAELNASIEDVYSLMTELVSIFSFAREKAFLIAASMHDKFRGDLADKKPGVASVRILNFDIEANDQFGDALISAYLPKIETEDQSNLVRLYRLAKLEEHINPISSFLYYYHILDYPYETESQNYAMCFMNEYTNHVTDKHIVDVINK